MVDITQLGSVPVINKFNTAIESDLYLRSAYWQIKLDDKAKQLSTINTHHGLFQVNHMEMGIKIIPVLSSRDASKVSLME